MAEVSKDAVFRSFNGKEYERINFKTKASLVDQDESHRFVSDTEKNKWNGKAEKSLATQGQNGLMSAQDKAKLDGITAKANAYVHPTGSGFKHIPAGGSSGQILRWAADGTATWGADCNTTYPMASRSQNGIMSASDKIRLDGMEGTIKSIVLNTFYPVGSIYMSTSSTNPTSYMGGTWEKWGSGRVPVGVDASDEDFKKVEQTGGSKREYAKAWIGAYNNSPQTIGYLADDPVPDQPVSYGIVGDHFERSDKIYKINHSTRVSDANGKEISKVQPYITCYMWKRTK